MVKVRIEKKPEIEIIGQKIWISGTDDSEAFGAFWEKSHQNGLIDTLKEINRNTDNKVLNSTVFGVSCVEKDPQDRSFYFFIATEYNDYPRDCGLEKYIVPACEWAVFENTGELPMCLIEAEMYAFEEWLPNSGYIHANAPEMELYPPCINTGKGVITEFWLPIIKK
mgnify:FL=1